jgi:hypothetical protein
MRIYFFIIIILFSNKAFSQKIISGNVATNAGTPISNANIVVTQKNTTKIIAFAITDSKGNFSISFTLNADSVIIKVTAIGFETKAKIVTNVSQIIQFALAEHATALPTVIVRPTPISENGDTTNYNVQAFTGKQDRMIGDVIAKLPGIEIDANGQITYNGKAISHYYIDGLDLLEGKYNIANKNIPADLVDKVQVLKNNQDIRLLDSLNTATSPALNLKLKNKAKNKFIGNAKIAVGVAPLLWDNAITGLRFNKDLQLITSAKNNNTGNSLASELAENITIQRVGEPVNNNIIKEEIIPKIAMPVPAIAQNRYLFNNSSLLNFNFLKLLRNKAQLKTNLSYINDFTTNESIIQSTYYFPTAFPINFTEKSNTTINTNKLAADFIYTINKKNIYLKNTSTLKLDFIRQQGMVQNNAQVLQALNNPFYQYANEFRALFPVRKKLIAFNSVINFNRMPQQLSIIPGVFAAVFNNSVAYDKINQKVISYNFNTDNSVAFTKRTGKLLNGIKLGIQYIFKNLQTDLDKISGGSSFALSDSFKNNINWNNIRLYAISNTDITIEKKQISIHLPIELNALYVDDKIKDVNTKQKHVFFNPDINFSFPLSNYFDVDFGCNIQHSIGSISQITSGYILTGYRNIGRNDSLIPIDRQQSVYANLQYKNSLNAFFANLSVSLSNTKKNIIYNQAYNNYFITSYGIYLKNYQKSFTINGSVSKYFIEQKINLRLNVASSFLNFDLLQQSKVIHSIAQINSANLNASFSKWAKIDFQNNSAFGISKNFAKIENSENAKYVSYNFKESIKIFFSIAKKTQLFFDNEYYAVWNNNSLKRQYFFGNVGFTKKFKKTELELELKNYTNNKVYTAINNFQNLTQINTYKIRPTNFMVKYFFNF